MKQTAGSARLNETLDIVFVNGTKYDVNLKIVLKRDFLILRTVLKIMPVSIFGSRVKIYQWNLIRWSYCMRRQSQTRWLYWRKCKNCFRGQLLFCHYRFTSLSPPSDLLQLLRWFFLGEIALAQATPPIATHPPSVRPSVCRLSHSRTLLKPFDRFTRHLAGRLASPMTQCVRWGSLTPREGEIWGSSSL